MHLHDYGSHHCRVERGLLDGFHLFGCGEPLSVSQNILGGHAHGLIIHYFLCPRKHRSSFPSGSPQLNRYLGYALTTGSLVRPNHREGCIASSCFHRNSFRKVPLTSTSLCPRSTSVVTSLCCLKILPYRDSTSSRIGTPLRQVYGRRRASLPPLWFTASA